MKKVIHIGDYVEPKSRNENVPLYLWIKEYKSILNVRPGIKMEYKQPGRQIVVDVMTRFFKIYKVPVAQYKDVMKHALIKFRSDWQHLPPDWQYFSMVNKNGIVGFVDEDFFGHPIKKIKSIKERK